MTPMNTNTSNTRDNTPLHCAIIEFEELDTIKMLLNTGANIHAKNHRHQKPLDVAIQNNNTQAALLLIRRGGLAGEDLNALLLMAIERKNVTIVKTLMDHGIKFNPLIDLNIPFGVAISQGQSKVMEHILPHLQFFKPSDQYIPREAVIRSDTQYKECIQLLLKWNFIVSPDSNHDEGFIYGAVKNGYLPIVLQLLKFGIDVNIINSNTGLNLLKVACLNQNHDMVEILLQHNACVNVTTPTNTEILNQQAHYKCNYLISSVYETNNLRDITCLHIAVLNSDPKMTELLLKYGAEIIDDPTFVNITRIAILRNCVEIVRIFLDHGLNVNSIDHRGKTLLHRCFHFDFTRKDYRYNIAKLLLERGANINIQSSDNSLLFDVVKHKHPKMAQLFLDYNADVQYKNRRGDTLLHRAIESTFDVEFIKSLLKLNLPVNAVNKDLHTPLHIACRYYFHDTLKTTEHIEALLDYNANINCTDYHFMTPLHFACYLQKPEVVAVLLENGANPNAKNDVGQTPLHIICKQYYNFDNGIAWKCNNNKASSIIQLLLQHNANTEALDAKNWTPLLLACKTSHNAAIKLLLNKANVRCTDKWGNSIAHIIVNDKNEELIKNFAYTQVNLNCVNKQRDTPLHIAVQKKSVKMIKSLIKYGANVNILNKQKKTPLYNAIEYMLHFQRKLDNASCEYSFDWWHRPWDYTDYSDYDDDDDDNYYSDDDINIHRPLVCKIKKYQKITKVLKTHVIKLKNAGLKVNNQNLSIAYNSNDNLTMDNEIRHEDWFFGEEDADHEDVNRIDIPQLEVECEREIEKMKTENIGVINMTFYDLLAKNDHFLSRFIKNKKIRKTLELEEYDNKFPLYMDIIRNRFRDAKVRYRLLSSSRKYFTLNICQRLSDNCLDTVFSYLNIKELKMFIKVMKSLDG